MINDEQLNDLRQKRKEYLETDEAQSYKAAVATTNFHILQFALIQRKPKLMWKLRHSLPVFFWLVSHVNRRDRDAWAELHTLYKEGYLVTVRHTAHMAKELGCSRATITNAVNQLEEYEFIQVIRNYTWGCAKSGWRHGNLYILGYIEDENEMWLYHTASQRYK